MNIILNCTCIDIGAYGYLPPPHTHTQTTTTSHTHARVRARAHTQLHSRPTRGNSRAPLRPPSRPQQASRSAQCSAARPPLAHMPRIRTGKLRSVWAGRVECHPNTQALFLHIVIAKPIHFVLAASVFSRAPPAGPKALRPAGPGYSDRHWCHTPVPSCLPHSRPHSLTFTFSVAASPLPDARLRPA